MPVEQLMDLGRRRAIMRWADPTMHAPTEAVTDFGPDLPIGPNRELEKWEEGCLSLPGALAPMWRSTVAICRGQDQYGDDVEISATGQLARCVQHETDHLHGNGVRRPAVTTRAHQAACRASSRGRSIPRRLAGVSGSRLTYGVAPPPWPDL